MPASPPPEVDLYLPAAFPPGVVAGVAGRSPAARSGRGLSFSPGAATSTVDAAESRGQLARALGVEPGDLLFARQVHGATVVRVARGDVPGEADGMVTDRLGLVLCLSIADCCAILAFDPVRRAVGAFHAGWRGARDGIAEVGVREMAKAFGSRPADLRVWLSPCASGDRYEVGEEVAALFPHSVVRPPSGKLRLDLGAELARRLVAAGVPPVHIERSPVCTITDPRCHSHRRDGATAGRMAAFITMRV
jgi:polyphenol oxidase